MRLIYLIQIKDNPFFVPRSLDPLFYHQWGIDISKGNWLGNTAFEGLPLYAYFAGVIYKIFGINLFVLRLAQAVLGALTCSFIFVLGKRIFNRKTAVLAGVIAVFYKPFIFYDAMVIGTNLSVFLYTLSLITAVVFFNSFKKRDGVICGFFIGITALCRPPILIFPVIMLITFLLDKDRFRKKIRSFLSGFIFLLIGLFLVLSCVAIRNYAVSKQIILLTSHGGLNFYIGNNPDATGKFHAPAGIGRQSNKMMENSKRLAERELGRDLNQSEVSVYWRNKGLNFIRKNPLDFVLLLLKKTYLFFQGGEITDFRSIEFFKRYSALLRTALPVFFLIIPWAVYGIIISFASRGNIALLRNFLFGYIFLIILYFINSRYRMPVVPIVLLFGAFSFFRVIELFFINKKKFYISICAVLSLYFITGIYAEKPKMADDYNELASWYMIDKKDFLKAICLYNEALKLDSDNQYVMFNLGRAYFERKRYGDALRLFKQAVKLDKSDYESYNFIGIILSEQNRYSNAVDFYKKAININRDYYLAYNNLATVYSFLGKYSLAVDALERSLIIKPDQKKIKKKLNDLKKKSY